MPARILARRLTRDLHCRQFTRTLVKIANRPKLPGSRGTGFPEFLKGHRENCPHKILAQDYGINENTSPEHCAKAISDSYKKLLYEHGLLLLQGFPLGDAAKFNTFLDNLDGLVQMLSKESAFRHAVDKKIYLASDYTNEATIEPHNEMSVAPKYPHVVLFACKQPGVGGESVLVDCASWFEQVDRTVRDEFAQKGGIKYRCYLMENAEAYNGKRLGADVSWKNFFLTDSKAEVESQLKANNREFFWHENNALEYWFTKPISINHHKTGTTLWFNQTNIHHPTWYTEMYPETWGKSGIPFDKFPFQVYYGDGSQIKDEVIQHIRNVAWTVAVGFQMQKNEVIIIDNERFAHARLDFKGDRKLFAAFLQDSDRLLDTSKMDSTIS